MKVVRVVTHDVNLDLKLLELITRPVNWIRECFRQRSKVWCVEGLRIRLLVHQKEKKLVELVLGSGSASGFAFAYKLQLLFVSSIKDGPNLSVVHFIELFDGISKNRHS